MPDLPSLPPLIQTKLLASVLGLVALLALRRLALGLAHRRSEDPVVLYRWRKWATYLAFALAAALLLWLWFPAVRGVSTFLGLLSAGLAIALKDPLVNLAGWGFIMIRRPFEVGDRIEIGEHSGDVIDVRVFQFTLLEIGKWVDADQSTGRIIHVPNGWVFLKTIANYSKGFQYIWNELPVLVTFESDWRAAKALLQEIGTRHAEHLSDAAQAQVREAARRYMIYYPHLTPIVYTEVRDSGVLLTVRYLSEPRKRRGTAQAIWEEILDGFAALDTVDFAYPTTRFYDNAIEGKRGTKPKPGPASGVSVPPPGTGG